MRARDAHEEHEFLIKASRGQFTDAEKREWERRLRSNPALREALAEEKALDRALNALPDVPISSNFTSLAVQAALRESHQNEPARLPQRRLGWRPALWARLLSGVAACLLVGGGALLINQRQQAAQRAELARKIRSFTEVASAIAPNQSMELFQNFDAIQRLSLPAEGDVDMELLLALQR